MWRVCVGGPLHGQLVPLGEVGPADYEFSPGDDDVWRFVHNMEDE